MIISIASGKGGTGKTTIAVNLALSLKNDVQYIDCDVEEPNGHIFLKPKIQQTITFGTSIPKIDLNKCTFCGKCQQICQFHALLVFPGNVLVFPELCHACAGCWLVCPEGAVSVSKKEVGILEIGYANGIEFIHGKLRIGEAMSPPLIREVKKQINSSKTVIIDAPPGTSCPVIESITGSDFVILVTEPTPFGLHDLKLAVEMIHAIKIPFGVIINRADIGNDQVKTYCVNERIPILLELNNHRKIAEAYSIGTPIVDIFPEYRDKFRTLFSEIERRAGA